MKPIKNASVLALAGVLAVGVVMLAIETWTYSTPAKPGYSCGAGSYFRSSGLIVFPANFRIEPAELDLKSDVLRSNYFEVVFYSDASFNSVLLFLPLEESRPITAWPPKFQNGTYEWSSLVRIARWELPTRPQTGALPWEWYLVRLGEYPWDQYSLTFVFGFNRSLRLDGIESRVSLSPRLSDDWNVVQCFRHIGSSLTEALQSLGDVEKKSQSLPWLDSFRDFFALKILFLRQSNDVLRGVLGFWLPSILLIGLLLVGFLKIRVLGLEKGLTLFVGIALATLPFIVGAIQFLPPKLSLVELLFYSDAAVSILFAGIIVATGRGDESNNNKPSLPRKERREDLRRTTKNRIDATEQYRQALEMDRHLTTLNWQIASILIAGVTAALALTLSRGSDDRPFGPASVLVSFLGIIAVSAWFLLVRRNRDIAKVAISTARQLEASPMGLVTRVDNARTGTIKIDGELFAIRRPEGYTVVSIMVLMFIGVLAVVILTGVFHVRLF